MPADTHPASSLSFREDYPILFILLGASNLARAYTALTNCLKHCLSPRPVQFLNALGPGRGYCAEGGILNIVYPPIRSCGILTAAREKAVLASRSIALVTDIGNDVMYGVSADEIISCLDGIFREFREMGADVIVIPIHVDLEKDVGEFYFRCLRRIFYPKSGVEFRAAISAVEQINRFLRESVSGGIHLLGGMEDFCGVDKIHFSLLKTHTVWSQVVAAVFRLMEIDSSGRIRPMSVIASLGSNMSRLFFHDMLKAGRKAPGTF